MGTLLIKGLRLEASHAWKFRPMGAMIMARRDGGVGSLQISLANRHDLRDTPTPEACLALAQRFVTRPATGESFAAIQSADGDTLFGGFSFIVGEEFNRVWYNLTQGQLVLGVYGCAKDKREGTELNESEATMRSAQYEEPTE